MAEEARKGFDLLVVGMDKVTSEKGGYDKTIEEVLKGFEGPIALVAAKGKHLDQPASKVFRILVPVSGSVASRRGAEMAIALSRARSGADAGNICFHYAGQEVPALSQHVNDA